VRWLRKFPRFEFKQERIERNKLRGYGLCGAARNARAALTRNKRHWVTSPLYPTCSNTDVGRHLRNTRSELPGKTFFA
jgi:hypothetical protein